MVRFAYRRVELSLADPPIAFLRRLFADSPVFPAVNATRSAVALRVEKHYYISQNDEMKNQLERTSLAHKAMAHPARVRMLAMLKGGELCLCQLTAVLELAPSTVSAHLAELRRAGLVVEKREGRWAHVRLARTTVARRALELLWKQLRGDVQVASDKAAVKKLRKVPVDELCSLSRHQVRRILRKAKARRK